jgi:hypothetical protein
MLSTQARGAARSLVRRIGRLLLVTSAVACGDKHLTPPAAPGKIVVSSGNEQLGDPGRPLGQPIIVVVEDAAGLPAAGVRVTWIAEDGGAVDPPLTFTNSEGKAAATWTLGPSSAPHRARAVAAGYGGAEFVASAKFDGELPLDVIEPLALDTYDGSGQTVHPDYVVPTAGWALGRQYLFITPYPNGNANFENPSIFRGTSPLRWSIPDGVTNPIQRPENGYLSDPDGVYVPERDELWLYFRQVNAENLVRLTTSTDGLTWSTPVTVAHAPNHQLISPSVVRRGADEWFMWVVNATDGCTGASTKVDVRRSMNGVDWSGPQTVELTQPGVWPWHIDVQWIPSRKEFWAMYNAKVVGSCTTAALYLATSGDGVHWTTYASPVLSRGAIPALRDVVYRSTFAYDAVADEVTIWYSGARVENGKYIWSSAVQRRRREDLFASISTLAPFAATASRTMPALVNFP